MSYQGTHRNNGQGGPRAPQGPDIELRGIDLKAPPVSLFDTDAERIARKIAQPQQREANKASQLRGFYDEIVMWEQRARRMSAEEFAQHLPLIRMLNARVAYAKGRKLVDDNFFELMRHCLGQVDDYASLRHCKLFFEAFMGFFKVYGDNK